MINFKLVQNHIPTWLTTQYFQIIINFTNNYFSVFCQAQFKYSKVAIMILFFCLIFPIGISIGIGVSNIYNENSPKALIVEGFLLSASAGVLINMALVDLVAADFLNSKMLRNLRLQLGACLALFIGLICMSILALMENS